MVDAMYAVYRRLLASEIMNLFDLFRFVHISSQNPISFK